MPEEPSTGPRPADRTAMDRKATDRTATLATVSAGCLLAAAAIGWSVRSSVPALDDTLHRFAVEHRSGVVGLAKVVTQGGNTLLIWPMVAVAALLHPKAAGWRRLRGTLLTAAGTGTAIGVRLASSDVFRRARPPRGDWVTTAGGFAYPSGHTTAATIGAGALAWAVTRHVTSPRVRTAVWCGAACYAVAVGWSRVWLGVHWPLDVVGGWLLGAGWLAGLAAVAGWLRSRRAAQTGGPSQVEGGGERRGLGGAAEGRQAQQVLDGAQGGAVGPRGGVPASGAGG
jgi:membrane-associated phospholipid phosphatase